VANAFSNNVMKLDANSGKILGTFAEKGSPNFVAFDGANIWVTNNTGNTVSKL
jgi:DNA-binding beta-propeller fold protein YncE